MRPKLLHRYQWTRVLPVVFASVLTVSSSLAAQPMDGAADVDRLVGAMLGETPLVDDLRRLTDEIGGRPTGSDANARSVGWALERFRDAGVAAWSEGFEMPELWLERSATARITATDGSVAFTPRIAAAPFSTSTPAGGLTAPLLDAGRGTAADFDRLGSGAGGAFLLIETEELKDIAGALDNGCNVALVIDLARQIQRLGLVPRRTIRFVLFNGEEQGLTGSWGYVKRHADELDRHVMASSYDIGSGRIQGFFTGGRPELAQAVTRALAPVAGLGPFTQVDVPIVGTDNYDFMMEGVGNLVANQESANYGPNYHARSDTFDKVDLGQLRLNSAVAAAVTWGFATMDVAWERQPRSAIEGLIEGTDLRGQMEMFGLWEPWLDGSRGRRAEDP